MAIMLDFFRNDFLIRLVVSRRYILATYAGINNQRYSLLLGGQHH